jgi:hypothetical protein
MEGCDYVQEAAFLRRVVVRMLVLKELFLSELQFRETAFVCVVSVDKTFHDDAPSC